MFSNNKQNLTFPLVAVLFCLTFASFVELNLANDVKIQVQDSSAAVTTASPQLAHLDVVAKALDQLATTEAPPKTAAAPSNVVGPTVVASPSEPKVVPVVSADIKPAAAESEAAAAEIPLASTAGVNSKNAGPEEKLDKYFEPICSFIEKVQPAQLFKIQSQMKSFVLRVS